MNLLNDELQKLWSSVLPYFGPALRVVVVLAVVVLLGRFIRRGVIRRLEGRVNPQALALTRGILTYVLYLVALLWALEELGFDAKVLLGAAGVLTVAVGFASQTSISNLISGLFLIVERPFVIGDLIIVDDTLGEVLSVDLLSVKLRTFDNLYVRMPNETMLKSKVTTITKYPLRRVEVPIRVGLDADLEAVRAVLRQVAERDLRVLEEPEPVYLVDAYADSVIDGRLCAWCRVDGWWLVRTDLLMASKKALAEAGFPVPAPHRVLRSDPTSKDRLPELEERPPAPPV